MSAGNPLQPILTVFPALLRSCMREAVSNTHFWTCSVFTRGITKPLDRELTRCRRPVANCCCSFLVQQACVNFYEHMRCTFESPKAQAKLALLVAYAGGTKSEAGLSTCYQNSEVFAVPAVQVLNSSSKDVQRDGPCFVLFTGK